MCGIVAYFGQAQGVVRVLEALRLLEYRAPDSAGLAAIDERGQLVVRRSAGPPRNLAALLAAQPLYLEKGPELDGASLPRWPALSPEQAGLRDCSVAAGWRIDDLYRPDGLRIGQGDRGAAAFSAADNLSGQLSASLAQAYRAASRLASPDLDADPVRHAFRLVAAHVASRVDLEPALSQSLDQALAERLEGSVTVDWPAAWAGEVARNAPGPAFAAAVRRFQAHFPGLAQHLAGDDWERVGGLTAQAMAQIVVGHGRWAMVGAVSEANAHPLSDRSGTRIVCENGSHNATSMLGAMAEQAAWWRQRGLPPGEPVHRSENTTEVIACEWERAAIQIAELERPDGRSEGDDLDAVDRQHLASLRAHGIDDPEEQALRLALRRLSQGNAHACALFSRRRPGTLYASSYDKAIAIASRTIEPGRRELVVASDFDAALMLWSGREVEAAATRIDPLRQSADPAAAQQEIDSILDRFAVDVIFLDADLGSGPANPSEALGRSRDLFARIRNRVEDGRVVPEIAISRYDGTSLAATTQRLRLNPAMVGRGGHASFTEAHIAEIPDVMDRLVKAYAPEGRLSAPGLNAARLQERFGPRLERLGRIVLAGEGSSWRDAQTAAPLLRELLPDALLAVYRPVELLNLGEHLDPASDLAVEISWSGATDSLLKVDKMLAELDVLRLAVTGRPQSDLGRRAALSGGTLDVYTGVEVSVATVKGFQGILMTLDLLALILAGVAWQADPLRAAQLTSLRNDLTLVAPQQVRALLEDEARRSRIRQVARRCGLFNKVVVIGDSPIDVEAELKIEELAQVVALPLDFHAESLRSLIEGSALAPADDDRRRTLFVVNATGPAAHQAARPILSYLGELGVFAIVHTTLAEPEAAWGALPNAEIFVSPAVAGPLQPLIDAPFFFDLAVALAYARGLTAEEIDRPRNLAKSVTTTGAERRAELEGRRELRNISLDEFNAGRLAQAAWDTERVRPSRAALRATIALRGALAVLNDPPPAGLAMDDLAHLVVVADCEATENAANMARAAWQELAGADVTVYRRFLADLPPVRPGTALLRLIRAGAVLAVHDPQTVALPADLAPLQLEALGSTYLIGLAVRLARQRGADVAGWLAALAQLPLLAAEMLADRQLAANIDAFLQPYVQAGYDKLQIIGGGQDQAAAASIARSLRQQGFVAEALYTDSAWHGPLATVGGPGAEHDTLIVILATDPLFQAAALVDTQVYRTRHAPLLLVVPAGNAGLPAVRQVEASAVIETPAVPRILTPLAGAVLGALLAERMVLSPTFSAGEKLHR